MGGSGVLGFSHDDDRMRVRDGKLLQSAPLNLHTLLSEGPAKTKKRRFSSFQRSQGGMDNTATSKHPSSRIDGV